MDKDLLLGYQDLLRAYRLAFGFTSMKDKQEIFQAMEEINPGAKQLILEDMENWQLEENPLGIQS
jgi:hypothetical protein